MGERSERVVLDTTVLSNFASTDAVGTLVDSLETPVAMPAVREELRQGSDAGHDYLGRALDALGERITVPETPDTEGTQLGDHLDPGETASLAYLLEHDGTLATDDLAARRAAKDRGVPVTGSIGLLVRCVETGRIDQPTADDWLDTWREVRGYYAPVGSVDELLDDRE